MRARWPFLIALASAGVLIAVAENAHSSDCQRQIPHWAYAVTWILGPVSVIAVVVGVAIYSYRTERLFVGAIVLGLIVGAIWFVAGAYTLFAIVANGCLS